MLRVNIAYNVEDETKRYVPNKSFYAEDTQLLNERCCVFLSKGGAETIIVPLCNVLSIKVEEQLD